jgi:hypothetical protein
MEALTMPVILITLLSLNQHIGIVINRDDGVCIFDALASITDPLICSAADPASARIVLEYGIPVILAGKNTSECVVKVRQPGTMGVEKTGDVYETLPWAFRLLGLLEPETVLESPPNVHPINARQEAIFSKDTNDVIRAPRMSFRAPNEAEYVVKLDVWQVSVFRHFPGDGTYHLCMRARKDMHSVTSMLRELPSMADSPDHMLTYTLCQFGCFELRHSIAMLDWMTSLLLSISPDGNQEVVDHSNWHDYGRENYMV